MRHFGTVRDSLGQAVTGLKRNNKAKKHDGVRKRQRRQLRQHKQQRCCSGSMEKLSKLYLLYRLLVDTYEEILKNKV